MAQDWLSPYMDRMEESLHQFFRYFHGRIEEAGALSPSQFFLVKVLEHGKLTVTDLATRLDVTAAGATGLVDRLVRNGLVLRRRDEADRRVVWVELSPEGEAALEAGRRLRREIMAEFFGALAQTELDQLVTLYEKAARSVPAAGTETSPKE